MSDVDPSFAGGDGLVPVLCEPATASEPCEGAFDDPPSGEDFETFCGVGAFDDFERPLSDPVECAAQFRPGISAVGDGLRALLEMRFKEMVREGGRKTVVELLRTVLGQERAAIVAAALILEPEKTDRTVDGVPETGPGRPFQAKSAATK